MQLLPVKKLNERIQEQKSSDIKAGLFLSRKVDALREEVLELEKKRDDFIAGQTKVINDSLEHLFSKKNHLESEIGNLEEKRIELLKPLDTEWEKVKKAKEELTTSLADLVIRQNETTTKEELNNNKEKELGKREEICVQTEKDTIRLNRIAKELNEKAKNITQRTIEQYKQQTDLFKEKNKEIVSKENNVKFREIDVQNALNILADKEKDLKNREIALEDKYATLQETVNYIEKKYGKLDS